MQYWKQSTRQLEINICLNICWIYTKSWFVSKKDPKLAGVIISLWYSNDIVGGLLECISTGRLRLSFSSLWRLCASIWSQTHLSSCAIRGFQIHHEGPSNQSKTVSKGLQEVDWWRHWKMIANDPEASFCLYVSIIECDLKALWLSIRAFCLFRFIL